jgi:hypothetical protein
MEPSWTEPWMGPALKPVAEPEADTVVTTAEDDTKVLIAPRLFAQEPAAPVPIK